MSILKAKEWSAIFEAICDKDKGPGFPIGGGTLKARKLWGAVFAFELNVQRAMSLAVFPQLAFRKGVEYGMPSSSQKPAGSSPILVLPDEIWEELDAPRHDFMDSIGQLMRLQLVSMWTAFETLAGDLWERAVNAHPKNLSELKGRFKKNSGITADDDTCDEVRDKDKKDEGRSISIERIQGYGFNLEDHMGTILRAEGKVKFDRLACIRDAYVRAFCKDNKSIRCAVYDPSLTALSIARNAIVHNAGCCDELSVTEVQKNPGAKALLPAIHANHQLELNGEIMHAILVPAVTSCVNLILAVDSWVAKYNAPQQTPREEQREPSGDSTAST